MYFGLKQYGRYRKRENTDNYLDELNMKNTEDKIYTTKKKQALKAMGGKKLQRKNGNNNKLWRLPCLLAIGHSELCKRDVWRQHSAVKWRKFSRQKLIKRKLFNIKRYIPIERERGRKEKPPTWI